MKSCVNRDAFLRINFLYQAAHTTLVENPENTQLARYYISTLKTVARRLVLRIHPHIKRSICKRCDLLLIPGVTATVRIRARREQHMVLTCLACKEVKRFLCREDYKLWVEQPEAKLAPDDKRALGKQKGKKGKQQQPQDSKNKDNQELATGAKESAEPGPSNKGQSNSVKQSTEPGPSK